MSVVWQARTHRKRGVLPVVVVMLLELARSLPRVAACCGARLGTQVLTILSDFAMISAQTIIQRSESVWRRGAGSARSWRVCGRDL